MSATHPLLEPFLSKKLEINLSGETDNMTVIDWEKLDKSKNEDYNAILDYFVGDEDCEEKINAKEWIPFGLLGLNHNPSSYEEMGHNGLLY